MPTFKRARATVEPQEKVLEVDARMQGNLSFKDPVNLRVNGQFEGTLETKGSLAIGEHATVRANVTGERVSIAGVLEGDVQASVRIELQGTARVTGNLKTPILVIAEGAVFRGQCDMDMAGAARGEWMTVEDLTTSLEISSATINDWANHGRLPGVRDGTQWKFRRSDIDAWIAQERITK